MMETSLVGFGITLLYTGVVGSALHFALTLHQHSPLESWRYNLFGVTPGVINLSASHRFYPKREM
jgi:hypothetical protein